MLLRRDGTYICGCCSAENGTLAIHPYSNVCFTGLSATGAVAKPSGCRGCRRGRHDRQNPVRRTLDANPQFSGPPPKQTEGWLSTVRPNPAAGRASLDRPHDRAGDGIPGDFTPLVVVFRIRRNQRATLASITLSKSGILGNQISWFRLNAESRTSPGCP
jgi:hypothetical protein